MNEEREARIQARLKRRKMAETGYQICGLGAILFAVGFLAFFFYDMISKGMSAFQQAQVLTEVTYNERSQKSYRSAVPREMQTIISRAVLRTIPQEIKHNPKLLGPDGQGTVKKKWMIAKYEVDQLIKGQFSVLRVTEDDGESTRAKKEAVLAQIQDLRDKGELKLRFNWGFFTRSHSTFPEIAGMRVAIVGSLYLMLITVACAVPIGVATAVYLEEFAPDNKLTQSVEININNLAAVPSILFGLLGLAIIINFFGAPRSSALAGGITLGLMMLPFIIIATRAALRAVPDSIREGAYGVGASPMQVVSHHVLPLALPGILTGTIISVAGAIGETAPLIIVGLNAAVYDPPTTVMDGTTTLPTQILIWNNDAIQAYKEKTAAGILLLLAILLCLNGFAIWLRNKTERKW